MILKPSLKIIMIFIRFIKTCHINDDHEDYPETDNFESKLGALGLSEWWLRKLLNDDHEDCPETDNFESKLGALGLTEWWSWKLLNDDHEDCPETDNFESQLETLSLTEWWSWKMQRGKFIRSFWSCFSILKGVGNFDLFFLSHFWTKYGCFCAHWKGDFLNFSKITQL